MRIGVKRAQRNIAVVWLLGVGSLFVYFVILSITSSDGDLAAVLWSWLLPAVMPSLSLIIGVLVNDSFSKRRKSREVEIFFYRLAISISFFYLFVVWLTVLLAPFSSLSLQPLLGMSQLWLAPLQGLASACLGAFFVRRLPGDELT